MLSGTFRRRGVPSAVATPASHFLSLAATRRAIGVDRHKNSRTRETVVLPVTFRSRRPHGPIAPCRRALSRHFGQVPQCCCHPYRLSPIVRMTVEWKAASAFVGLIGGRWTLMMLAELAPGGSPLPRHSRRTWKASRTKSSPIRCDTQSATA